jgi:mannose-6-phosphate isomerase-like protein (cupin superfamily)
MVTSKILSRDDGTILVYPRGGRMTIKVRSADTGGAYALLEFAIPPGGTGSPLHYHVATEEAFYLVEGELSFTLGDRTSPLASGEIVFVPRGVAHTFMNTGNIPAHLLIAVSPGDFEGYFLELAGLARANPDGPPDEAGLLSVAVRYGQVFVDPTASRR